MTIARTDREDRTGGRAHRQAVAGFTMVEVIVALTLLGITTIAIFGAMRSCSQATQRARMLTGSVLLAERMVSEMRLRQKGAFESREGQEGPYRWRARVAPTPVESLGAVHIQVTWSEQQLARQYDLFSLVHMQSFEQR